MPDRHRFPLTALLVALTVLVQVAAVWAVGDPLQAVDTPAPVQAAENDASSAVPIVVLLLVELVVVYGAWLLYQRLPAWLQRWARRGLIGLAIGYALIYAVAIMPPLLAAYAAVVIAYLTGYLWLAYDVAALVLGVVVAATLGGWLGPVPLIVLLVALMAYDHVAVVETDVMNDIVKIMASIGLPAMVVIPKRADFELTSYLSALADDGSDLGEAWRDRVHVTAGVGDFAIPAALTAAVFRFAGPAVAVAVLAGTAAGMVALSGRIGEAEALPGLPWLGGGAIGGYAGAMLVVWMFTV